MKRYISIILAIAFAVAYVNASIVHTVERGESLESIAKKYNVSQSDIVKLNPGSDKLFYVGMKLNIPETTTSQNIVDSVDTNLVQNTNSNDSGNVLTKSAGIGKSNDTNPVDEATPGWDMAMRVQYGFLKKMKGANGTAYAYSGTIGANYWFITKNKGPYAGAMIGYDSANMLSSGSERGYYYTVELKSHFISLPIYGGYTFKSGKLGIGPYLGFSPKYCVKSKYKEKIINGEKRESDGDTNFAIDFNLGLVISICDFDIFASMSAPLEDNQKAYFGKDAYLSIGIGLGF